MQKGYKRTGKAIAVLHFFIGLIVVAIILIAAYFCLERMDYSHRLNPDTTVRAYVEMTASPDSFGAEDIASPSGPEDEATVVDLIPTATPVPTPEPTPESTPTPEPTPIPTPSPTPTATPEPTPEPTIIPSDMLSRSRTKGFTVPDPSSEATAALTKIYVSEPNNKSIAHITGYAYINDAEIDAAQTKAFLILSHVQEGNGIPIAYQGTMTPGVSGVTHEDSLCQNPSNADFEVVLGVSNVKDDQYKLGVVLQYPKDGKTAFTYYEFPDTLTIEKGAIVSTSTTGGATLTAAEGFLGDEIGAEAPAEEGEEDALEGTAFGDGSAGAFPSDEDSFGGDFADEDFGGGDFADEGFGDEASEESFGGNAAAGASVSVG